MTSSIPKPGAHRRRGYNATRFAENAREKAPPLPRGIELPARQKARWAALWTHDIASDWDEVADFDTVLRYVTLSAKVDTGKVTAAEHSQLARLESELGLTPAARQRRYVELRRADEPEAKRPGRSPRERFVLTDPDTRRVAAVDPNDLDERFRRVRANRPDPDEPVADRAERLMPGLRARPEPDPRRLLEDGAWHPSMLNGHDGPDAG